MFGSLLQCFVIDTAPVDSTIIIIIASFIHSMMRDDECRYAGTGTCSAYLSSTSFERLAIRDPLD